MIYYVHYYHTHNFETANHNLDFTVEKAVLTAIWADIW